MVCKCINGFSDHIGEIRSSFPRVYTRFGLYALILNTDKRISNLLNQTVHNTSGPPETKEKFSSVVSPDSFDNFDEFSHSLKEKKKQRNKVHRYLFYFKWVFFQERGSNAITYSHIQQVFHCVRWNNIRERGKSHMHYLQKSFHRLSITHNWLRLNVRRASSISLRIADLEFLDHLMSWKMFCLWCKNLGLLSTNQITTWMSWSRVSPFTSLLFNSSVSVFDPSE